MFILAFPGYYSPVFFEFRSRMKTEHLTFMHHLFIFFITSQTIHVRRSTVLSKYHILTHHPLSFDNILPQWLGKIAIKSFSLHVISLTMNDILCVLLLYEVSIIVAKFSALVL